MPTCIQQLWLTVVCLNNAFFFCFPPPLGCRSYYSVQVTEWQAYPHYGSSQDLPPVELHPNLYYLNGIEWAGSAMEMSSVAAKNIALLAYHRWSRQTDMVDQKDLMHRIKTEL